MSSFQEEYAFIDAASLTFSCPKEKKPARNIARGPSQGFSARNKSDSLKDTLNSSEASQERTQNLNSLLENNSRQNIHRISNEDLGKSTENKQLYQKKVEATYLTDLLERQREKSKQIHRNLIGDASQSSDYTVNHEQSLKTYAQRNLFKKPDNMFHSLLAKISDKQPLTIMQHDTPDNLNKNSSVQSNLFEQVQVPKPSILRDFLNFSISKKPQTQRVLKIIPDKQGFSKGNQSSSNMIRSTSSMSDQINNSSVSKEKSISMFQPYPCGSPTFRTQNELLFSNSLLNTISSEELLAAAQSLPTQTYKKLSRNPMSVQKEDRSQGQIFQARELTRSLARAQTVKFNPHFHRKVQTQNIPTKGNPRVNGEKEIDKSNTSLSPFQAHNKTEEEAVMEILPSRSFCNSSRTTQLPNLSVTDFQPTALKPHIREIQKKQFSNLNSSYLYQNGITKNKNFVNKSIDVQTWQDSEVDNLDQNFNDYYKISNTLKGNFKNELEDPKVSKQNNGIIDEATGSAEMSSKNSRCQSEYLLSIYDAKDKQRKASSRRNQRNNIFKSVNSSANKEATKCKEEDQDKERSQSHQFQRKKVIPENDKVNEKGSVVVVVVPNKIDIMKQVGIEIGGIQKKKQNQQPPCLQQLSYNNSLKQQLLKEQQLKEFQKSYFDDLRREYLSNQNDQQLYYEKQQQNKGMYLPLASKQALKYFFNSNLNQQSFQVQPTEEFQDSRRFDDRTIYSKLINTSAPSKQLQDFCQQDILIGTEKCQSSCSFSNKISLPLKQHRMNTSSSDCNSEQIMDTYQYAAPKTKEHLSPGYLENSSLKLENSQVNFNQRTARSIQVNSQQNNYSSARKQALQEEHQSAQLHSVSDSKFIKNLERASSSAKQQFPRDIFTSNVRAMKKRLNSYHH